MSRFHEPFQYRRKARPTEYDGVEFRSNLEATIAAFWDRLGLDWAYEPRLEIPGYWPDLLLRGDHEVLVEAKPLTRHEQYETWCRNTVDRVRGHWTGCVLVVGAEPLIRPEREDMGVIYCPFGQGFTVAEWVRCARCSRIGFFAFADMTAHIVHPCGHSLTAEDLRDWQLNAREVDAVWRRAKNVTQWKKPEKAA